MCFFEDFTIDLGPIPSLGHPSVSSLHIEQGGNQGSPLCVECQVCALFVLKLRPYSNSLILLVEDNIVGAVVLTSADGSGGDNSSQLTCLDVALVYNDAIVVLQCRSHQVTSLVQGEATGVSASSRGDLNERQSTGALVDRERDNGVGRNGDSGAVESWDGKRVLSTRRDEDKSLVRLDNMSAGRLRLAPYDLQKLQSRQLWCQQGHQRWDRWC